MSSRFVLAFPMLVALLSAATATQCLPRPCEGYQNCLRQCDCTDATRNQVIPCSMHFRCDLEKRSCDDEFNMGCDELCGRFAARSACGTKVCANEAECVRLLTCLAVNPQTGQVLCSFQCDVAFGCDTEAGACEPGFAQNDETICAQFCTPPPGCGF
jgi:hypothetical protein